MGCVVEKKKGGHGFFREVKKKTKQPKKPLFPPPTFLSTLFLSLLTLFLAAPIPLNLPSPDPLIHVGSSWV